MFHLQMQLSYLDSFPKYNFFYKIEEFQGVVETCIDNADSMFLKETHLERLRDLIASSRMAITDAQKQRIFSLKNSDHKMGGIFGEIFTIVERQTPERQQQTFGTTPFIQQLLQYLPKKDRFRLANVSKGLLFQTDQYKIDLMNRMSPCSHPGLREQCFPDMSALQTFLTRNGQKIKTLNLHHLNPSNEDIVAVSVACPQLETLYLSSGRLDDQGAAGIAKEFKDLTRLDLTWCHELTDKGVIAIAESALQLKRLSLDMSRAITDVGVLAVIKSKIQLEELHLGGLRKLTNAVALAIPKGQKQLKDLYIIGCHGIKRNAIAALAKDRPELFLMTDH